MLWYARATLMLFATLLALSLLPEVQAQQLPPGVKVEVLGDSPSTIPGIEKIVRKRFTLAPGAKLENFTPANTQLCTGTRGQATVVKGDKKSVHKAGQSWVEEKGVTFTIENTGKVPFVDMFFELVEKK